MVRLQINTSRAPRAPSAYVNAAGEYNIEHATTGLGTVRRCGARRYVPRESIWSAWLVLMMVPLLLRALLVCENAGDGTSRCARSAGSVTNCAAAVCAGGEITMGPTFLPEPTDDWRDMTPSCTIAGVTGTTNASPSCAFNDDVCVSAVLAVQVDGVVDSFLRRSLSLIEAPVPKNDVLAAGGVSSEESGAEAGGVNGAGGESPGDATAGEITVGGKKGVVSVPSVDSTAPLGVKGPGEAVWATA